jgi:large subunit ribosomal protein L5
VKNLKNYCKNQVLHDILIKRNKNNVYQGPSLKKITVSVGIKEANINSNKILPALTTLLLITGQQPEVTKAKKSIANFKLRQGKIIGCKITLRGSQMYNFLEKFIYIAMSQITDGKALRYKNRRATNHLSIGIKDSNVFPELENQYELLPNISGINIDFYTNDLNLNKKNTYFSALKFKFN